MQVHMQNLLQLRSHSLKRYFSLLDSLSPLRVVERGYSIVKSQGKIIKDSKSLVVDQEIEVQFAKGEALAKITKIIFKK